MSLNAKIQNKTFEHFKTLLTETNEFCNQQTITQHKHYSELLIVWEIFCNVLN